MRSQDSADRDRDQTDDAPDSLRLRRRAQAASGIRFDKIEEICRAIAAGDYRFDADRVAERILERLEE